MNRVVIAQPGSSYVALSYVWPQTDNPFKTQRKDFSSLKTEAEELPIRDNITAYFDIPLERLPKTIQDALQITRAIGEKYLWVDALCIIQDDMLDVQRTVYKMDEIYKAASLTIIMGDREGVASEGGRPNRRQLSQELGDTTYIRSLPSMSSALERSVWQSRGWTYQEWELSARKLVFVGNLAYYNCPRSSFREDHVEGPFDMNRTEPKFMDYDSPLNEYCRHVETYSSRSLTNSTDIIDAFQGIMHAMARQLTIEFCWGLPLIRFDGAMLWMGVDRLTRRTGKKAPKPDADSVPFPSWSWVGWQGAVRFRPNYHTDNRSERTHSESAVNRLGHIKTLITWPWQHDFELPPGGPRLEDLIADIVLRGVLRFVTSVARVDVGRLRALFATQRIGGWKLDDGTMVTDGWQTCIVLSEAERPNIGSQPARVGEVSGRSPITTYNVLVVEQRGDAFERRGLVKITRKIWEACRPKIRWVTLV
ncbi:heterokaryon incompatibility protein-domain-containing protein [Ustulina deusta]|nr:heterokaryon incompatibility protein-domain-containing protein [Ustulina deusta]